MVKKIKRKKIFKCTLAKKETNKTVIETELKVMLMKVCKKLDTTKGKRL